MGETVAIIGALDTKGEEFAFLKARIEEWGLKTFVFNTGVLGEPKFIPDVSAEEVASYANTTLEALRNSDRGIALDAMAVGIKGAVLKYFKEGLFDGIISLGGGGGTGVSCTAMRELPIGVPKIMVSTVASADVSPYIGTSDINMMPSIVDVAGLNRISIAIISNAANAISGMVSKLQPQTISASSKPLIAASMFGNTTRAVDHARKIMEDAGYEVIVFHSTGTGGKTMERLISEGYFEGVLDITTTEWADEICGGVLSASEHRLEAAAIKGIPQIVTPGCIDMCNFWGTESIPSKYQDRKFFHWNPNVTLMRTNVEENIAMGKAFAERLNKAIGPIHFIIPEKGFSEVDAPGKAFWNPEANQAFIQTLEKNLRTDIPITKMDNNINDPDFSKKCAEILMNMIKVS